MAKIYGIPKIYRIAKINRTAKIYRTAKIWIKGKIVKFYDFLKTLRCEENGASVMKTRSLLRIWRIILYIVARLAKMAAL